MAKNLIFLADGTGNDGDTDDGNPIGTNVVRMYRRLRNDIDRHRWKSPDEVSEYLRSGNVRQITQYDPGVGARPTDFIGKATGRGISKNIKDGYEFLIRFYEPGDRIYLFGFSRGAYTVRSLAGLIRYCGIPRRHAGDGDLLHDVPLRMQRVDAAFDIYKSNWGPEGYDARSQRGDQFIVEHGYEAHKHPRDRTAYCIGVWDTVRSLGLVRGWRDAEIFGFRHRFHDHELSRHVPYAFHALSIDDPRKQFFPTIWNEPTRAEIEAQDSNKKNRQKFEQVWFPGVHSDVGGGYRKRGLADVTLAWMVDRMLNCRHKVLFAGIYAKQPNLGLRKNPLGKMHDPLEHLWSKIIYRKAYRYVTRGKQVPGSRWIEPIEKPSPISKTWLQRFTRTHGTDDPYIPNNLFDHPDIKKARIQVNNSKRPLPGKFKYFV